MQSQHVCNPWCIDGVHAIFFDTLSSERLAVRPVAERLAFNAGLIFQGFSQVPPQRVAPDGKAQAIPASRGRIVIWCTEGAAAYPQPPADAGR